MKMKLSIGNVCTDRRLLSYKERDPVFTSKMYIPVQSYSLYTVYTILSIHRKTLYLLLFIISTMPTTSKSSESSESRYTALKGFYNAFVYVDESNLCIQGGKEWARKHPESPNHHLKWQYDLSVLEKCIGEAFGFINNDFHMAFHRYGSDIQPISDEVRARLRHGWDDMAFKRDGREKQVDTSLVVDMIYNATMYMFIGIRCPFAIVSGDADMIPAAVRAAECGFDVHIWSWKDALSSAFGEIWNTEQGKGALEGLVSLHYLDDYLDDLTMGHSEKTLESSGLIAQRCRWRKYCNRRNRCNRHHTEEEKDYFYSSQVKVARKYNWCDYGQDCRKYTCKWAHSLDEIFCPTCEVTGDHHMDGCPKK